MRFQVDFGSGHKTGFFCDQRENRHGLAGWVEGKRDFWYDELAKTDQAAGNLDAAVTANNKM